MKIRFVAYKQPTGIDSYTKLMLHLDDVLTEDDSYYNHTVTNTDVTSDTVNYKFASGSGAFNGNSWLKAEASEDFNFGTDDFTIDFWIYFNNIGGGGSESPNNQYMYDLNSNNGQLRWYNGSWYLYNMAYTVTILSVSHTPNTGQWYHVAVVRSGDTFTLYLDGTSIASGSDSGSYGTSSSTFTIGEWGGNTGPNDFGVDGNIDEFRISKGIARWTSDFTPPDAPYGG
jgi:hypothetical protein